MGVSHRQRTQADDSAPVCDALLEALLPTRAENPPDRQANSLCDFVRYLDRALNHSELCLLVGNSVPSATVSTTMSNQMIYQTLAHIGKWSIHENNPSWWASVASDFDMRLKRKWDADVKNGVQRENFLASHRDAVKPFIDKEAFDTVTDAWKLNTTPPLEISRRLMSNEVCRSLVMPESLDMQVEDFEKQAKTATNDAELHDFSEVEMAAFDRKMTREVQRMSALGHKAYGKGVVEYEFLDTIATKEVTCLYDKWVFKRDARVKEIAISLLKVKRIPWETLLYGDEPVPNMPVSVSLPAGLEVIINNQSAREAISKLFGTSAMKGNVTFTECRSVLQKEQTRAMAMSLDRTFFMEIDFVCNAAEAVVETQARADAIAAMPSTSKYEVSMNDVLDAICKLKSSRRVLACNTRLKDDLDSVHTLVSNIKDGIAPGPVQIAGFNKFFLEVLHHCSYWCKATPPRKGPALFKATHVYGRDAMDILWKEAQAKPPKLLLDLAVYRRFAWLLMPADRVKLDSWVKKAREAHKSGASAGILDCIHDGQLALSDAAKKGKGSKEGSVPISDVSEPKSFAVASEMGAGVKEIPSSSSSSSKALDEGVSAKKARLLSELFKKG